MSLTAGVLHVQFTKKNDAFVSIDPSTQESSTSERPRPQTDLTFTTHTIISLTEFFYLTRNIVFDTFMFLYYFINKALQFEFHFNKLDPNG